MPLAVGSVGRSIAGERQRLEADEDVGQPGGVEEPASRGRPRSATAGSRRRAGPRSSWRRPAEGRERAAARRPPASQTMRTSGRAEHPAGQAVEAREDPCRGPPRSPVRPRPRPSPMTTPPAQPEDDERADGRVEVVGAASCHGASWNSRSSAASAPTMPPPAGSAPDRMPATTANTRIAMRGHVEQVERHAGVSRRWPKRAAGSSARRRRRQGGRRCGCRPAAGGRPPRRRSASLS